MSETERNRGPSGPWWPPDKAAQKAKADIERAREVEELRGCWAKLDRASEHLKQLNAGVRDFLDSEPYRVAVDLEEQSGWHVASMEVRQEVPMRLGAIVGDVIHNLRSALDLLAWQLALKHLGGEIPERLWRQIAFPIARNQAGFNDFPVLRHIGCDARAVLERLEPYPGGKEPYPGGKEPGVDHLHGLKAMDEIDKHRVLLGSFVSVPHESFAFEAEGQKPIAKFRWELQPGDTFGHGTKLARMRFRGADANTKVSVKQEIPAGIRFGDPVGFNSIWLVVCGHQVGWTVRQFWPVFKA